MDQAAIVDRVAAQGRMVRAGAAGAVGDGGAARVERKAVAGDRGRG